MEWNAKRIDALTHKKLQRRDSVLSYKVRLLSRASKPQRHLLLSVLKIALENVKIISCAQIHTITPPPAPPHIDWEPINFTDCFIFNFDFFHLVLLIWFDLLDSIQLDSIHSFFSFDFSLLLLLPNIMSRIHCIFWETKNEQRSIKWMVAVLLYFLFYDILLMLCTGSHTNQQRQQNIFYQT